MQTISQLSSVFSDSIHIWLFDKWNYYLKLIHLKRVHLQGKIITKRTQTVFGILEARKYGIRLDPNSPGPNRPAQFQRPLLVSRQTQQLQSRRRAAAVSQSAESSVCVRLSASLSNEPAAPTSPAEPELQPGCSLANDVTHAPVSRSSARRRRRSSHYPTRCRTRLQLRQRHGATSSPAWSDRHRTKRPTALLQTDS